MRIGKTSDKICYYLACISLAYFFFINYAQLLLGSSVSGIIYILLIVLLLLYAFVVNERFEIRVSVPWLMALVVMLCSSKEEIAALNLYWVTIYLASTLLLCIFYMNIEWVEKLEKPIGYLGNVHIWSTIILWLFSPHLYNATLQHIWGGAPGGVVLTEAYKAGITSHYSTNGSYCAIFVLLYASILLAKGKYSSRKRNRIMFSFIMGVFALLLTTKRAHLLFSIFSIVVAYYYRDNRNKTKKIITIIGIMLIALMLCLLLAPVVPFIGAIVNRFIAAEDISTGRFSYWVQVWDTFMENKLFGIGWGQYAKINRYGTGAHNVYLQLLSETGLVGFGVFIYAMAKTYIMSIKNCRKFNEKMALKYKEMLLFSITVQTFYLLYCFTGNCLYDMNMFFYYLVCSISLSIHRAIKKEPHKILVYNS